MSDLHSYTDFLHELKVNFCDFPQMVSIETYAICNAACGFCPYPNLSRKGELMPDDLIEKIIMDLTDIPAYHNFQINLSRINEPFLDHRIFDIARTINEKLPQASLVFFSNGSPLNDLNIEKLASLKNVSRLNISLNEYEAHEYNSVMGLPFDRTLSVLTALHSAKLNGPIYFPITCSRVGDGSDRDDVFKIWVKSNFPAFNVEVSNRSDWLGLVDGKSGKVPDVGCSQWFKLHFLSNGREAFCCIDAEGKYGKGDARKGHVLEIYNSPERRDMRQKNSRVDHDLCGKCPLLS